MTAGKPLASVSLDLDDLWTYLKTRGDPAWEARPSYLPAFVPQALDLLERLGLQITVFVVGADAVRPANLPHLRAITERGHRIGNHSFSHECWLHLLTNDQLECFGLAKCDHFRWRSRGVADEPVPFALGDPLGR